MLAASAWSSALLATQRSAGNVAAGEVIGEGLAASGRLTPTSLVEMYRMKRLEPIESLILTIRGCKVLIDADLAAIYGVENRALNQAVKRNSERFPKDFIFQLNAAEKLEVITNCDHLARLKFAKSLPFAFTEHGALMAATVLSSPRAVAMSVYVVRAFIQMREQLEANREILKRLTEIDKTLLGHDSVLREIYQKLLPLLQPPPETPKRRIGFGRADKS